VHRSPVLADLDCIEEGILQAWLATHQLLPLMGSQAMPRANNARTLVGPYGLRAFVVVMLILFAAFLLVFNFTNFF
jgi:hypothetical protein